MKKIIAVIVMARPLNGLVAALTLLPAVALGSGRVYLPLRIALATFLIASFGYIINDLYDFRTDKINKPRRPFPARRLSAWEAVNGALLCLVLGAVALAGSETAVWVFFAALAAALFLYSFKISSLLVVANFWVAVLCSSACLLGGLITHAEPRRQGLLLGAGSLIFLYHLGREIIKDIEDVDGDRVVGRRTIPIVWGVAIARYAAALAFVALTAVSYLFHLTCRLSSEYLMLISLAVNLPLVLILALLVFREREGNIRRASVALKVVMIPALVALTVAGIN